MAANIGAIARQCVVIIFRSIFYRSFVVSLYGLQLRSCQRLGVARRYGLAKRIEAVRGCRNLGKKDLKWNDALPKISVDPETYEVRADGELLTCEPAKTLPLARRYCLF